MTTNYLTLDQLGQRVNRAPKTIREHIRQKWLKAEKIPGAIGWRVKANEAHKWAGKYLGLNIAD